MRWECENPEGDEVSQRDGEGKNSQCNQYIAHQTRMGAGVEIIHFLQLPYAVRHFKLKFDSVRRGSRGAR